MTRRCTCSDWICVNGERTRYARPRASARRWDFDSDGVIEGTRSAERTHYYVGWTGTSRNCTRAGYRYRPSGGGDTADVHVHVRGVSTSHVVVTNSIPRRREGRCVGCEINWTSGGCTSCQGRGGEGDAVTHASVDRHHIRAAYCCESEKQGKDWNCISSAAHCLKNYRFEYIWRPNAWYTDIEPKFM